jgi:hypothetical protein
VTDVNEDEITKIKVGQNAFLKSEAFTDESLLATVSHITPKADPVKKVFRAYLLLPRDTPLRIGMTVEANIVYREKPRAVVVPLDAVAGDTVQAVNGDRVSFLRVTTGVRGTKYVEVIGDVSAGTLVLSPARIDVADGSRVKIDESVMTAAGVGADSGAGRSSPVQDGQASHRDAGVDAAIAAVLQAHIQSLVADARRNNSQK